LQNEPHKFPMKYLYRNFDTLVIPELYIHQLLILAHKFLHHKHSLHTAFANYFIINSAVHWYNTRLRENLHFDFVSTNYGKRTVRYKARKIWNRLLSSLKEFTSVNYFSNKLKEFLQVVDIDSIFKCMTCGRACLFLKYRLICFAMWEILSEHVLSVSVFSSLCL